ncbi:DUF433 domain-containing protein [Aphanothece hegewaldii CCALA 016]|uniref:DUF433 domain-containing protein n=1 Tax=Aphanothece hegewaldii CCALA 016 TaxID=2107694 RepID=A0A2T1LRC3_9CHRO|nr:DUF433 domain-containing protein [Aphanothece hegewaldii]PSF31165.1 DUF433 domain-containing protein [Aphanothece hegewaldii CCALA 016]
MNTEIITIDSEIMMGKPIIKGTRITVERILEMLAAGETTDQIIEAYPFLTKQQIDGAIQFAIKAINNIYIKEIA